MKNLKRFKLDYTHHSNEIKIMNKQAASKSNDKIDFKNT